jgi:uncharacterized protein YkwD
MSMKGKKILSLLLAGAMTAALLAVPAQAAERTDAVRVSSYKGSILKAGERSGLIIGPSGNTYTVTSSDPTVIAVEQVLTFWVAVAKSSGTATITATNRAGESGGVTLTVESAQPIKSAASDSTPSTSTVEYSEIRQEIIQLVNQTRRANGASELTVNDALMNAAQACSDKLYTCHHNREECEAVAASGYPYGFGSNNTVFTGAATADIAQRAVTNWINSPGHFRTMIDPTADCIGVGVTQHDGVTYCYLFVGKPDSINPYS